MTQFSAALMKKLTPEVLEEALRLVADRERGHGRYPLNSYGVPEYRSIVFRMDHLFFNRAKDGLDVQKMVMSIEEPQDAMMALITYYSDTLGPDEFRTMLAWADNRLTDVMVYFVPEQYRDIEGKPVFEIVCGTDLHNRIAKDKTKGKFSYLQTRECILDEVERVINLATAEKRALPKLISVAMYKDNPADEQPEALNVPLNTQQGAQEPDPQP